MRHVTTTARRVAREGAMVSRMSDSKKILRVTAEDLETGDKETWEVPAGEYVLVTTEPCHVSHTQIFGGGKTVQLTIKDRVPR